MRSPVGRLFWKFFFALWLAQLLTTLGVSAAVWALRADQERARIAVLENRVAPPRAPPAMRGDPDRPMPRHGWHRPAFVPPLMPLATGSLASLVIAALLAWYFSQPIHSLKRALGDVAAGRLHTRVGAVMGDRRDELSDLGKDFDRMAERMQQSVEAQRRLLHDVSHEMRSPLARLQAAAGLMRQQPDKAGAYVERIERDIARIDTLVGELLTLARLDAGMLGDLDEEIDLSGLLGQIAEDAAFEGDAKHCQVELDVPAHLVLRGNHELLGRAVENVVRNAIRHSPEGVPVRITAGPDSEEGIVRIAVQDRGSGVPDAQLESIFEPFHRAGASNGTDGYGLGLAIARRVVQVHGGSINAANRPDGGLEVTLLLPNRH